MMKLSTVTAATFCTTNLELILHGVFRGLLTRPSKCYSNTTYKSYRPSFLISSITHAAITLRWTEKGRQLSRWHRVGLRKGETVQCRGSWHGHHTSADRLLIWLNIISIHVAQRHVSPDIHS